ncbi:MAG: ABC transporter permease [Chloroflexi bacterium]|nr:ABC transporter permease [Chloroflexota bacterium]
MHLLRNLTRRKVRTTLTILGITIGIWALVVFGSMANKINSLVEGGSSYFGDKIIVTDASDGVFGNAPMSLSVARGIDQVQGVAVAVPQIQLLLSTEGRGLSFDIPDQLQGQLAGADQGRETFVLRYTRGRGLAPEDEGRNVVVLGADLARDAGASVGGTFQVRDRPFEIVGILEPTLTAPDTTAYVPLRAAQEIFAESLPPIFRADLDTTDLASQVVVYPEQGADIAAVAARIETQVPNAATLTGAEFDTLVGSTTAIFNAIIVGVALISLVVGGLSVINTMAMAVAERTREIGIKRAIGGPRRRIIRELVTEAGLIGLIGGLLGLILGAVVIVLANEAGRESGTVLFELTPETAFFAVVFSTGLGMLAGLAPAWNAARLDPVTALRYE